MGCGFSNSTSPVIRDVSTLDEFHGNVNRSQIGRVVARVSRQISCLLLLEFNVFVGVFPTNFGIAQEPPNTKDSRNLHFAFFSKKFPLCAEGGEK